jgi:hypothetical protein
MAAPAAQPHTPAVTCAHPVHAQQAAVFSAHVWAPQRWRRGSPPTKTIRAHRHQVHCAAGHGHRAAIRHRWRADRRAYYEYRWQRRHHWQAEFEALSEADQQWAISTGACESGNVASTDTGNGFQGAFQWVQSTWEAAGGSGSPADASWYEQAVRAVRWRDIAGAGQWPACG